MLGEIPAHWEMMRLRHLVNWLEQGWSPDCENRQAEADEWGVLKAGCVNRGVFEDSEHKTLPPNLTPDPELEVVRGDLLMSRASGSPDLVGSVAVAGECRRGLMLCDKLFRLHLNSQVVDRDYLAQTMNSRIARWQIEGLLSGGSGLANNVSQRAAKDLWIPCPPINDQRTISAFVLGETERIGRLMAKVRVAIARLSELRAALISSAVTGKIDVREEAA